MRIASIVLARVAWLVRCTSAVSIRLLLGTRYWILRTALPLLVSRAQQIHEQPHCSGNARGELPEKCIARVDVRSLAVLRPQQAALLRIFSRIVRRQQGLELLVPLVHEVQATLLHPAVEIVGRNRIRIVKDGILRRENFYRSL